MLRVAMWTTIKTLKEQGKNKAQIARITGHDWKTVDKVIRKLESGENNPRSKTRKNIVNSYKEYILELLEKGLNGVRIYEELTAKGFNRSYETVKYHIRNIRRKEKIFVRIHIEPREETQADFGYTGRTPDNNGKLRKPRVFNMRLRYSRLDNCEKIESVALDGAQTYFSSTNKYAINATIVLDRFHAVQKANKAIDQVRRNELRKERKDKNQEFIALANCKQRFLLLKKKSKLSTTQSVTFKSLCDLNEPIYKAMILKDAFMQIYECENIDEAKEHLVNWTEQASESV